MYRAAEALKTFFAGFGIPAYDTGSVPDDVGLPYIAYNFGEPEWGQKASGFAQVWDRSRSNAEILLKADQIVQAIGEGKRLPIPGGYVFIWPETPSVQIMKDGDFRYAYINLSINSYHMPGI